MTGSAGGITSDDVTVTRAMLPKGYTGVTRDSDDEVVEGQADVSGDLSTELNCSESKVISAGYTSGGTIKANSLASQTPGNADASKILSGYSAWVNGQKVNGSLTIQSIVNFRAALHSTRAIMLSWENPIKGPYSGVVVVYRTDGRYPENVADGTVCYDGPGTNKILTDLPKDSVVWFRAWNYITTNLGRMYGDNTLEAYAVASAIEGQQTFTSNGVFTVPDNVYSLDVFAIGGGHRGEDATAASGLYAYEGGDGGESGIAKTVYGIFVVPGQQITVTVARQGETSVFGTYVSAPGGKGYGKGIGASVGPKKEDCWTPVEGGGPAGHSFDGTPYGGQGGGGGGRNIGLGIWHYGAKGGIGGGGRGGSDANGFDGLDGIANTGSGGGGGGYPKGVGGAGASGIVIVRWGY